MHPVLTHYLIVAAALFVTGLSTVLLKRNAIGILMGVELMLNAANINLVAFDHFSPGAKFDGQMFAIFVIVVAAAEAAVALAIVLNFYKHFRTVDVEAGATLKG